MVGRPGLQSSYACTEKDRGTLPRAVMQVSKHCSGAFWQKGRGRTSGGARTYQKCILINATFITGNCRFVDYTVHLLSTMVTIDNGSPCWTSRHACMSATRQFSLEFFPADTNPCLKTAKKLSSEIGATQCWRLAVPLRVPVVCSPGTACKVDASHLCVGQRAR
jgi:hypothetical protein